jgi:hypothetical protein
MSLANYSAGLMVRKARCLSGKPAFRVLLEDGSSDTRFRCIQALFEICAAREPRPWPDAAMRLIATHRTRLIRLSFRVMFANNVIEVRERKIDNGEIPQ